MILGTLHTLLPECVAQIRDGGGNGNNAWNIFLLLMVQNTCEPAELGSLSNDSYVFFQNITRWGPSRFNGTSKHGMMESNGPKGERLATQKNTTKQASIEDKVPGTQGTE